MTVWAHEPGTAASEPAAGSPWIRVRAPRAAPIPLVLDSPHSGTHYPEDFDHAVPRDWVRRAEDTHVEALFGNAPTVGASLVEALFPRTYIDANRALSDLDPELLDGEWPEPLAIGPKTRLGIGLVWRLARGGRPMYARRLTVAEVRRRIDVCWRPYHAAVQAELDARHARFGQVWHLNCHSMPSVGDSISPDPGRQRVDFVIGDRDGSTCGAEFTALVVDTLRGLGHTVAVNDPYKGVELVRRHGRPGEGRHSLQIEVNRRLYMDEDTLARLPGFSALRASLRRLLATVAVHVRARVG